MDQGTNLTVKLEICHCMNIMQLIIIRDRYTFTTRSQLMDDSFTTQLFSYSEIQT
jgi:hypothetical protein